MAVVEGIESVFFFFNDTATTEIYTLSLHDALPISCISCHQKDLQQTQTMGGTVPNHIAAQRSEEHTSELQSPCNLVCRLLLEKKKISTISYKHSCHSDTLLSSQMSLYIHLV